MIEVKNVTKKYGSFKAVDNISFEIKENEIVGFLGPNGAGKTTTMNMITGFIEPTEGEILINGINVVKHGKKAKKQIGYMPETTPLYYDLTPREFVKYIAELRGINKKERKQEVQKILEGTGLIDVQDKLIKNLSRGYKQRVSMAGALVGNPEVLILDEPTVGLDPKQITEIRELIRTLGKDHTVILSSHILSEISQICEKVIIINKGKIVAIDTPNNLEEAVKEKNNLSIVVEDSKGNMNTLKEKFDEIIDVQKIKENTDGTVEYIVTAVDGIDLRRKLFDILPKEEIVIFELKKVEATLEDAFLKLIDKKIENEEKVDKYEEKKAVKEKKKRISKKEGKGEE